jgi:hypothetical protein
VLPQSDKGSPAETHAVALPEDDEATQGPDYDARQALRLRRGLLDPRVADFRRSLNAPRDQSTWHVRCRVLGGGGEYFFPLEPSLVVRRPVYRVFLNLRQDRHSPWTQRLPPNWRDMDIRISFSREFASEVGLNISRLRTSELQDQLGRDEFNAHLADLPGTVPPRRATPRPPGCLACASARRNTRTHTLTRARTHTRTKIHWHKCRAGAAARSWRMAVQAQRMRPL